jgi:hypothetical protein
VGAGALGASLTGYVLTYLALLVAYFVVVTHLAASGDDRSPGPSPNDGALAGKGAE